VHLAEDKKKVGLRGFFDKLSDKQKKRVVAAGMDRAGAYGEVVEAKLQDSGLSVLEAQARITRPRSAKVMESLLSFETPMVGSLCIIGMVKHKGDHS